MLADLVRLHRGRRDSCSLPSDQGEYIPPGLTAARTSEPSLSVPPAARQPQHMKSPHLASQGCVQFTRSYYLYVQYSVAVKSDATHESKQDACEAPWCANAEWASSCPVWRCGSRTWTSKRPCSWEVAPCPPSRTASSTTPRQAASGVSFRLLSAGIWESAGVPNRHDCVGSSTAAAGDRMNLPSGGWLPVRGPLRI